MQTTMTQPSGVLIVDDHSGFRTAARAMLEQMGLRVVGEAASGEEAIAAYHRLRPNVLLLDVQLPGIDGIEVARTLFSADRNLTIILTSSREREDYGDRLHTVPEVDFICKSDLSGETVAFAIDGHEGQAS